MDQQIFEILTTYKQAIDFLTDKVQELEEQLKNTDSHIEDVQSMIFDDIIGPAQEAMSAYDKDQRFNDFNSKYGERLGKYQSSFAPFEDEGFDLTKQAFDEYDNIPDEYKPDVDAYVDEVESIAQDKLASIKQALGIPQDANLEIKETDDAVEVKADGETVEVEQKEGGDGEAVEEETTEKTVEEPEDGESVEDFEASLKESL